MRPENRNRNIESVQQRALRYWFEDGLTETAAGCMFVLLGILFLVEASAPRGSLPANFSAIGQMILIVGGIWIARKVVAALKERITYPRTGYVAYRRIDRTRRGFVGRRVITVIVGAVVSALLVGLLTLWKAPIDLITLVNGLVIGIFLLYLAHRFDLVRFYALAILSVLIGVAASLAGLKEPLSVSVYFGAMGIVLIVSGGTTLWAYLAHSAPPREG